MGRFKLDGFIEMDGSPTYHPNYYLVEWRTHNGVENIVWSDGYAEKARIQLKDAAFGLTETSPVDITSLNTGATLTVEALEGSSIFFDKED